MGARGIVVQPGQGAVSSFSPGRSIVLKLQGGETCDSIMLFEETIPAGAKSTFHLHHDSDEVAYVLSGNVNFVRAKCLSRHPSALGDRLRGTASRSGSELLSKAIRESTPAPLAVRSRGDANHTFGDS